MEFACELETGMVFATAFAIAYLSAKVSTTANTSVIAKAFESATTFASAIGSECQCRFAMEIA
jgi:predicted RecB family endonuclease